MPQAAPEPWDRVLVRHVTPSRWGEVERMASLLKLPFSGGWTMTAGTQILGRPRGRWMIAAQFPQQVWVALFSNAASAQEMFEANKNARRLEVAWYGFRPEQGGWFFQLRRAGKRVTTFAQGHAPDDPRHLDSAEVGEEVLAGSSTRAEALGQLCSHYAIPRRQNTVRESGQRFEVIGLRGKPVKGGLNGYVLFTGPAIAKGENKRSEKLTEAIKRCDPAAISEAVAAGAALDSLPGTSVSPLLSALFMWGKPQWKQSVEALLKLGCPVNGAPGGEPPIVAGAQSFVGEAMSLAIAQLLVEHGADVNAADASGQTALFEAVVNRKLELVHFLMEHGADPQAATASGQTVLEWLRHRVESDQEYGYSEYAPVLEAVTGERVEQPGLAQMTDELWAENKRFQTCLQIRQLRGALPQAAQLKTIKASRLANRENCQAFTDALLAAGFAPAGHFIVSLGAAQEFLSALVNPKLRFDAIFNGGAYSKTARLEIAAHHPDGTITSVANEAAPRLLEIELETTRCENIPGSSPSQLVARLREKLKADSRGCIELDAASFKERYLAASERLLAEVRNQLERILRTPASLIDGKPPRYEKLGCYLKIVDERNPTWSTAKITEHCLEDVRAAMSETSQNALALRDGLTSTGMLLALRHLQVAGAPRDLDFLDLGTEIAVRQFGRGGGWPRDTEELLYGLMLAMLADRWDAVGAICESLKPSFVSSKGIRRDSSRLAEWLLVVASGLRKRPIRGAAKMEEEIQEVRQRHPKLLLKTWKAILASDESAYARALHESLAYAAESTPTAELPHDLLRFLAWPESVLLAIASHKGLASPSLPNALDERLIRPSSVRW